ncbi:MAG TPA: L-threonylcarbamoyladenylate synthase [Candidatus Babeliaceae bacterium]|nr:L-threonylcarbamoyladenylate synthase [Candidatus Babeliaceae bacterium]
MPMVTLHWDNYFHQELIVDAFRANLVCLTSTDTVLGLATSLSYQGFVQLNKIKQRSNKPYLILIGDLNEALTFSHKESSALIQKLGQACWPGPLTIIAKPNPLIPNFLLSYEETIALRVPHHKGLLEILQQIPALFSTSANEAGKPIPHSIAHVQTSILSQLNYSIVDTHILPSQILSIVPSTIVDVTKGNAHLVRLGSYTKQELEQRTGIEFY